MTDHELRVKALELALQYPAAPVRIGDPNTPEKRAAQFFDIMSGKQPATKIADAKLALNDMWSRLGRLMESDVPYSHQVQIAQLANQCAAVIEML